ncbi:MAG: GHMP kinase [Thermoflexales bacterium]|nr:GHMP kinase [Thermoflexales bacterium]
MIIRSKAPLRVSFAGGGTEVEPYLSERGGAVLSMTIDRYAYSTLRLRDDRQISVTSLDYDTVARFNLDEPLVYDGQLDLVKAVIRRLNRENTDQGLDFFLHSDAPPGSGLGSSSTLVVALIGLFKHWQHLPLTNYEIADLAYQIERIDLGIHGGKQDQYAATFGGFNFIEFSRDATIVNPLRVPPDTLNELHYNLLLCYTGQTRLSARIIDTQVERYVQRKEDVVQAMDEIKQIALALKNALLQGRLSDLGALLHEAWVNKKKMAAQISNPHIDELYETARKHGALGGKISGAGGGGHMFFYCQFDKKHRVAQELERLGARIVEFNYDFQGLQTWRANF